MNRNDWITTASWWLTSAPCLSSCWTISTCPSAAARCNGVALACLNQYQLIRDDVIWYYAPIKYQILRELGKQLWIQKIIISSPIHRPMFGHSRRILKSYGAFLFIFFKQFKKKKKDLGEAFNLQMRNETPMKWMKTKKFSDPSLKIHQRF